MACNIWSSWTVFHRQPIVGWRHEDRFNWRKVCTISNQNGSQVPMVLILSSHQPYLSNWSSVCTTTFDFTVSVAVLYIDNNNIQNYVSVSAIVSADIEPGTNQLSSSNQDIKRISYIEPGNSYSSSGRESSQRHSQSCTLKNNDQQSFGKINGNC